jgi:large subunit ribosomal protein L33
MFVFLQPIWMSKYTIVMLFRSWDSVRYEFENNKDMAKKNKDARVQVILECTEQKASGVPGMSRYITTKNKKNTPERLELKKYNPFLKKMTVHKEIK